jgi:hypothetical protein
LEVDDNDNSGYNKEQITTVKSFIVQAQGENGREKYRRSFFAIKVFSKSSYKWA